MNFILKLINLHNISKILVFCILINASLCEFDGLNKFKRKKTSRENYIHPNMLTSMTSSSKTSLEMDYIAIESSLLDGSQTSNGAVNSLIVPLLVRRFVNILLKKAVLKNSDGEAVLLDTVSENESSKLSMSLKFSVNTSELKTLREFGWKKRNLTIYQIDELLNSLFNDSLDPDYHACKIWPWEAVWPSFIHRVDGILVLHIGIVLCLVWILVRIIQGRSSWILLPIGLISSTVIWEVARLLEEETIKSHSEQLRLAEIPEHCLGIDNRSWWEKLFREKPEAEECFQYHYYRASKPVLRVSYFKAVLNLFGSFLEMLVTNIRILIAPDKDQWFFSNWFFQALIIPTLFLFFAFIFTIYLGGSVRFPIFSFGGVSARTTLGSHVQTLPVEDSSKPKAPPRQKNGRKRKEIDQLDGGSSSSMVVFHVKGGNFTIGDTKVIKALPDNSIKDSLDTEKKEECKLCRHNSSPIKKEKNFREEIDLSSEETDENSENEEMKGFVEDGSAEGKICEKDILAGGDSNVTEEVLGNEEQNKL